MGLATNHIGLMSAICLMFFLKDYGQLPSNEHEVEVDSVLKKENPEYYYALKSLLIEFEDYLVASNIVVDQNYNSYKKLLNKLEESKDETLPIDFHLGGDSLEVLVKEYDLRYDSRTIFSNARFYNLKQSKEYYFNQMWAKKASREKGYRLTEILETFFKVYDAADLKLPLVKLKLFRYLDPSIDAVVYVNLSIK